MSQYSTGTVNVTNASASVVGVGTTWTTEIAPGDLFVIVGGGVVYEVATVPSNTSLTLTAPYGGTTATGASYVISRDFTPIRNIPIINKGDLETAALIKRAYMIIDGLL